jgi:phosphatidate cytidylyltransferase
LNLVKRIIIAVIFIPTLLWFLSNGGLPLKILLALLTGLSTLELVRMFDRKGINLLYLAIPISVGLFYFILIGSQLAWGLLYTTLIIYGVREILRKTFNESGKRISISLFAVLYPAIGFAFLYRLFDYHHTLPAVLAIIIWVNDTFAFITGKTLGKHKGIFPCSPRKSLEGFIGGALFTFVAALFVRHFISDIYTIKHVILLTLSVGIFGQLGDLFESVLKRDMNVKDSSNLIPGHGGVLDRFDSILWAAPVLYFMLLI